MTKPSALAIHFEARKVSYRQTKEGVVVSLLVHPNEVAPELAAATLGTVYTVAMVEMSGDSQPVPAGATSQPWEKLKPSQQAGIRCNDPEFQTWLAASEGGVAPDEITTDYATSYVRAACGVKSRNELDKPGEPQRKWRELDATFRNSLGLRIGNSA